MEIFNKFNKFKKNISNELEDIYNKINSDKSLLENMGNSSTDLHYIIYPIYYFFDNYIDKNIGSTMIERSSIRKLYKLDEILNLDENSIMEVPSDGHSTILYKFKLNGSNYLYYSNSGLGINNNIMIGNYVAPKIFKISNDLLYDFIPKYIEIILSSIIKIKTTYSEKSPYALREDLLDHIKIFSGEYLDKLSKSIKLSTPLSNNLDKEDPNKIKYIENIIEDLGLNTWWDFVKIINDINNMIEAKKRPQKCINLCYSLLYYFSYKLKDDFKECFFIDLITNQNNSDILNDYLIKDEKNEYKLEDYYDMSKREFEETSKRISEIIGYYDIKNERIENFKTFIKEINHKLEILSEKSESIKFKLDQLKIHFNNVTILNPIQKAGSCAFYSYYFLKNITLLEIYNNKELNNEKKVNKYIDKILEFHYKMIYLYGLSQDTNFIENINYSANDYFNYNFINNLCDTNNLTEEFIKIYDKDTCILNNKNKQRIDHLLDFDISKSIFIRDPGEPVIIDYTFYVDLFNFLKEKVSIIRSKIPINHIELKDDFDTIFEEIYKNIDPIVKNIDPIVKNILNEKIWYSLKNIYYIYLLLLVYVYKNNLNQIKDQNFRVLYFDKHPPIRSNGETVNTPIFIEKNIQYNIIFMILDNIEKENIFNVLSQYNNFNEIEKFLKTFLNDETFKIDNEYELIRFTSNYYKNNGEYDDTIYNILNSDMNINFSNLEKYKNYNLSDSEQSIFNNLYILFCKNNFIKYNENILNSNFKTIYDEKINNIIKYFRKLLKDGNFLCGNYDIRYLLLIISNYYETIIIDFDKKEDVFKILSGCKLTKNLKEQTKLVYINTDLNYKILKKIIDEFENESSKKWCDGTVSQNILRNFSEINFNWIKNIKIETLNYKEFIYEKNNYVNIIPLEKYSEESSIVKYIEDPIYLILARFGISYLDQNSFLILCDKKNLYNYFEEYKGQSNGPMFIHYNNLMKRKRTHRLQKSKLNENCNLLLITSGSYNILNSKLIILNIKNNIIDNNNVYIIDEKNKKQKFKFNLTIEKYPFLSFIPKDSIYLYYENLDLLDVIVNSKFKRSNKSEFYQNMIERKHYKQIDVNNIYNDHDNDNDGNNDNDSDDKIYYYNLKAEKYNVKSVIINFKIGPSSIFPINSFNIDDYRYCFNYYRNNSINLSSYDWENHYKINNDFSINKLTSNINDIIQFCECRIKYDLGNVKNILKKNNINNKNINNFIETHKFCSLEECTKFKINEELIKFIKLFKENIKDILSTIDNTFYYKNNINDYIVDNFEKWLLIMENNILIQNITELSSNNITCWDIQLILNTLNSLLLFNEQILKNDNYYKFELLFLLQLPYFYKENQLNRYHIIRNELQEEDTKLKVHQFMMGKGKTSVFTPLLSLCIKYLKNKQPTVITASHLVKDTRNIVKLSEFLLQMNINVFSDYEAKERWIMNYYPNKDEDKLNLNNEFNIIDEFDSHHNYLQSMFNYVQEMSIPIKEDIFNYIFDFTLAKIRNTKINNIFNKNKIINDYPLLNENLESFYYISESMRNKESYGLSFKYAETPIIERIAIPFLRKDTPAINSDFSSILLRLILTFKIYILEYNSLLQDFDYNNIYNNTKILNDFFNIDENLDNFIINNDKESDKFIEEIKKSFDIIYDKKDINLTNKILKKYLYNVNQKKIKYAEKQLNMSFIDIIYNNHKQWQVGYTGTAYLKLNKYEESEKFVFRDIIPDPEEKMEILLALNGFGNPSNKNKKIITSIIKISNISNNLNTENLSNYNNIYSLDKIIDVIIDNPRGFIDLAGLFINYKNKTIAENILNYFNTRKIKNKNIIFLNENHEAFEINNENKSGIKYTGPSDNNFYYYDQTHTVGTDIKQPQTGHVAIIINKNNRMSEFAQAIFRFRKLNRGTYLSVILFEEDYSEIEYSNDDIYKMLLDNETNFNDNQKDGLKYQLFKAMIRKIHINNELNKDKSVVLLNNINSLILNNNKSNNIENACGEVYEECDIIPEFVRKEKINRTTLLKIIKNNIIKKDSYNKNLNINNNIQKFIKKIYDELKDIKELELSKLVIGSGNETVTERSQENNEENNEENDEDMQKKTDKLLLMEQFKYNNKINKYSIKKINFIKHLNCSKCIHENCTKLFNDKTNIKINGKDIYISYNFLINFKEYGIIPYYELDNLNLNLHSYYQQTLMYIEFNDKILIETFIGAMNYYIYKLPVYAYNGKIINPLIYNQKNKNKYILDIDNDFIELLGIEYKNPNLDKIIKIKNKKTRTEKNQIINDTINNLTPIGKIILVKHLLDYKKNIHKYNTETIAYDVSELFIKDISKLLDSMTLEKIEFSSNIEHISESDENLDSLFHNICFPINIPLKDYKLVLDENGYIIDEMDEIPLLSQYLPNREINELPFFK